MNILVTGGAGYIGSHVVKQLLDILAAADLFRIYQISLVVRRKI